MPIPKRLRSFEIEGRLVRVDTELRNKGGRGFAAGAVAMIADAKRNLTLQSGVCPTCGTSFQITRVTRDMVSFLKPEDKPGFEPKGVFIPLDDLNSVCNRLRMALDGAEFADRTLVVAAFYALNTLERSRDQVAAHVKPDAQTVDYQIASRAYVQIRNLLDEMRYHATSSASEEVCDSAAHLLSFLEASLQTRHGNTVDFSKTASKALLQRFHTWVHNAVVEADALEDEVVIEHAWEVFDLFKHLAEGSPSDASDTNQ